MFAEKMKAFRDWFERLTERERRILGLGGVAFIIFVAVSVGGYISNSLSTFGERNADMRQALRDLETQRDGYLRAKAKSAQLETRLGHSGVHLQGYLEQAAKEAGVEIPESNERQAPAGKHFIERAVDLRLRQVKLAALTTFLKKIETGPNIVVVTALNIRTRDDKHMDLDVEMTVSSFERSSEKKDKPGAKKGDKT